VRNGLLAGAAAILTMTWIQYYLLVGGVAFAAMVLMALVAAHRRGTLRLQIRAQAAACSVVALVAASVVVLAATTDFEGVPTRPEGDAYLNSARPLMYLVPGPGHPLLGHSVGRWVRDSYPSPQVDPNTTASYSSIYLGIPLLILAGVGTVLFLRGRVRNLGGVSAAALALTAVGLVFSAPPTVAIGGVKIPLPYDVITHLTTAFRVAARFSMLVMFGVCVIAAVGLVSLLARRRPGLQAAALAVLVLLVGVDEWARPVPSTTHLTHPAIYDLLARQPQGVVAEYPLSDTARSQNVELLYQHVHKHPIFDGWHDGSDDAVRKLGLNSLLASQTAPALAAFGVHYVLVRDVGTPTPPGLPRPGAVVPGLREIGQASGGSLYRVVARPPRFLATAARGFEPPEGKPPGVQWINANGARLELQGHCAPCAGVLQFDTGTFARPRVLTVRDQAGHVLRRRAIASAGESLRVPVRFTRRTVLRLDTQPAPDQIDQILHNGDTRSFGVFVGLPVRFIADPKRGNRWTDIP
jgi:hypothetical protein